jgi:hypothetical protein
MKLRSRNISEPKAECPPKPVQVISSDEDVLCVKEKTERSCSHTCENWDKSNGCCACSDMRPHMKTYPAYNNSSIDQVSKVGREYYYCPTCKYKNNPLPVPKSIEQKFAEVQAENEQLKKKVVHQKEEIESLNKTITVYENRLAKAKDVVASYMDKEEEAENDKKINNLMKSGLDEIASHLGYCSDVLGDCFIPAYEKGGLAGLRKKLRETSMYVHKDKGCRECYDLIGRIHD